MIDAKQVVDSAVKSVEGTVKKGRRSVNKAVDKVVNAVDPASIALPETPINLYARLDVWGTSLILGNVFSELRRMQ